MKEDQLGRIEGCTVERFRRLTLNESVDSTEEYDGFKLELHGSDEMRWMSEKERRGTGREGG